LGPGIRLQGGDQLWYEQGISGLRGPREPR
jgi:hypothetical protein